MQPGNREPLLTQDKIIPIVVIAGITALIFLGIWVVVYLFRHPSTTPRVGSASTQVSVTATVFPTGTVDLKTPAPVNNTVSPFITPTRPPTYILQKGEWPICIARRYNLDLGAFFAANGLNMNSEPATGTTLKIQTTGEWDPANGSRSLNAHPAQYTVKENETLNSIACRYGDVYPDAILSANALTSASEIKAGQTLQIP
jgi:LysM repeat protein